MLVHLLAWRERLVPAVTYFDSWDVKLCLVTFYGDDMLKVVTAAEL